MNTKDYYQIGQLQIPYCRATYNKAYSNERVVEVGLGGYFLFRFGDSVVEVGSVMMNYGWDAHTIIDLSDTHPKVLRINALEVNYRDLNVLSISTIEHMMRREYNNGSNQDSITVLNSITTSAKNYLITFPCCYNEFLDEYMKISKIPRSYLKRISHDNRWEQELKPETFDYPFGHGDRKIPDGYYNNANGLFVVTNLPEILNTSL